MIGFNVHWGLACIVRLQTYQGLLPFGTSLVGLSGYKHIKVYYPLALRLLDCQATNISRFTTLWCLAWIGLSGYKHTKVYYPLGLGLDWVVRLQTYQGLLPFGAWLGLGCQATNISRFTTLWHLACWIVRLQTYQGLLPFGAWLGLGCQATNISRFTTLWRLAWVGLSSYKNIKVYYPLALGLLDCQATNISPSGALMYYTIYNCESSLVHIIKFYQIWSKEEMLIQSY